MEAHKVYWGLDLEQAHYTFCHILLAKAIKKISPCLRSENVNYPSLWEELQNRIPEMVDTVQGEELESFL